MLYYFEAEPDSNIAGMDEYYGSGYGDDNLPTTREGFSGGGVYRSDVSLVENQDILNNAVIEGLSSNGNSNRAGSRNLNGGGNGGGTATTTPVKGSRDHYYYGNGQGGENGHAPLTPVAEGKSAITPGNVAPIRGPTTKGFNLSPVGIIDLECYSVVNRSSVHDCVFELTGDSITNPDLRSFYFQAGDVEDTELWTNALISDRHSALRDEREAYRQVCDSFQLQLQNMSDMIDSAEAKVTDSERQLYKVRSHAEKNRTEITNVVREAMEQKCWGDLKSNQNNYASSENGKMMRLLEIERLNFLDKLDEVLSSANTSMSSSKNSSSSSRVVQLLADYLAMVACSYTELNVMLTSANQKLNQSAHVEQANFSDLKLKLEQLEREREEENAKYEAKIARLESQLHEAEIANEELQNQMGSQRMEFSMFQNQAKTKLQELSSHKKILKKEVIELRKKIEGVESERDAALHISDSHKSHADTAREKNSVLENYIEKMENQVKIQQNMMEMMSLSGMSQGGVSHNGDRSGSVVGRIIGQSDDQSFSSFGNMMIQMNKQNHRLRQASPLRLPPKSRLPPDGPPMVAVVSKKDSGDMTSPLSNPHSPKRERQMDLGNSDADVDQAYCRTPRGTLDGQLNDDGHAADADTPPRQHHDRSNNLDNRQSVAHNDRIVPSRVSKYEEAINEAQRKRERLRQHLTTVDNQYDDGARQAIAHDPDNDDDNKSQQSNVSELTEDRTQRAFESAPKQTGIHYTMSDMTGENIVADAALNGNVVKYEKASVNADFPPRYIISSPDGSEDLENTNLQDTSMSKTVSTYSSNNDVNGSKLNTTSSITKSISTSTYSSTNGGTKLTVAQRARMAAESPNIVDVSNHRHNNTNQSLSLKEGQDTPQKLNKKSENKPPKTKLNTPTRLRSRSASPGVFSNLGKRMVSAIDNSIIGVKVPPQSQGETGVTKQRAGTPVPDPTETNLTLAERQKLQRERQIRVLREKGLINEDGERRMKSNPRGTQ